MSVKERIFHSFMFELVALLLLTIAVVLFTDKNALGMSGLALAISLLMWVLALDFITVLLLDIGFVVFCCFYAIVFNWLYDKARAHWLLYQFA
ncbi:chlorhexidine efflux transporter [Thalassotalea sp. ND16A]|uniref:chlorhexidine efflux transporter n=1 Tax=Thalassotalea sp. ND16A TaxID=1535422 RepID=UPI00051A47DB|nr:chlorhexidine efflux transporter [Thalassotalea sp. ND16A]KGJ98548.1 hypothetical protein ND16A_0618 [Thalassotalea sp. ND16A]